MLHTVLNYGMLSVMLLFAGIKPNGEIKVRAVDHMTESMVNEATGSKEKLKSDTLDMFFELSRSLVSKVNEPVSTWKADIDSAFRRIPISPEHRPYAHVAFVAKQTVQVMQHNAMPFGAVSSVFQWDPIGTFHRVLMSACVLNLLW